MHMILVLRVISQICQCFEDKEEKQKEQEAEPVQNDYPLYLQNRKNRLVELNTGSEVGDNEEFLKTLQTVTSRRSVEPGYKQLLVSDTKRTRQEQNLPELYPFVADVDENLSTIKMDKNVLNSPQNVLTSVSTPDPEDTLRSKGRYSQPLKSNGQQQPTNLVMLIQQNSEGGEPLEEHNIDQHQQADRRSMKEQEQEEFEYFEPGLNSPINKMTRAKPMFDLETRVKRNRKRKHKAKPEPESNISPYRVNLPKDLQNFAVANRPYQ